MTKDPDRPAGPPPARMDATDRIPRARIADATTDEQRPFEDERQPFEDELETAVALSDDDIESIEMMEMSGVVEHSAEVVVASETSEPSVIVDQEPGSASWDDVSFYYREAVAVGRHQPERTGLMWFEAARTAQLARSPRSTVLQYLQSALEQAPNNPPLVFLVRREMVLHRQYDSALTLTDRLIQAGGSGAERIGVLLEAATVQRHVKGDRQKALELVQQALTLQPGNAVALVQSATYQMELGQHAGAADALEQLSAVIGAPSDRSSCLHAAGTLRELRLGQPDRAEQDYDRALEVDPENLPAWIARSYLHLQTGAWSRLGQDLERLAALQRGNDIRIGCLLRAGVLHIHRTGDLESAARIFGQAAEVAPDTAPLSRLAQVYEATGQVEQQVVTLQRLLQLTLDPVGQALALMRIGHLYESQLGREDQAIAAYRQALQARPGHFPALQALGAIFRRRGDWNSLLEILLPETEGSGEEARRAMRCVEVGGILTDRLQRPEEAIDYFRRALELDPDLRLAGWRLVSLLLQQQRFVELARVLAWQAEATTDSSSRFHLLLDLARVQKGPLDASREAMETLKQAWSIGRNRVAAMELLELYEQTSSHKALVELLLWEAGQTRDLPEATWRRIQAAMVLEDHLEEHDRALEIFREVLDRVPTCVGALRAAGQIYYAHGRWQELIDLHLHELEHEPALAESGEPWCRIGRIYDENLGNHDEAIRSYNKALALDDRSAVAMDALERLIRIEQRHHELVPILQQYAHRRPEPHAAADILCRAAELADARLDEPARAIQLYQEALELHPHNTAALYGLLDLQQRQNEFEAACVTLQRLTELARDAESRCLLLLLQARVREFHLGQVDATPYDLVAQTPKFAARVRLDQIRTRLAGDGPTVTAALLAAGSACPDNMLGAGLLTECALRCEWGGEIDAQREAAHRALTRNQDDLAATWCLQRALHATGDWSRLGALLESEAERHADSTIRVTLLGQAAQAFIAAGTPTEAARLSRQCLTLDRQHLPSLRCLVQLAAKWRNYTELAALYDQLAATCVDRTNRLQACLLAADCWSEYVVDPVNAMASLKRVLAEDPQQPDAFARAWRLLSSLGDHGQLSLLYARRISVCEDPQEKAQLLQQQIELLRDQMGDLPGAIASLNSLLELTPDDVDALQMLADLSQATHRWSDAADTLARLAHHTRDGEQRQKAWLGHASIALKQLQKPRQALTILQHLLQADPDNLEAKQLLVEVYVEQGQWEEAQRLLEQVALLGKLNLKVWAVTQQAEVARVGLRDEKLQEQYEREALTLASAHPGLLDELVDHYRKHRRQRRLLEMASKVDRTTNPGAAGRLSLVLARLLIEDFDQPDRAMEYVRECLAIDPKNVEAQLLMGEVLEHRGEMPGAVDSYRKLLSDDAQCVEAYRGLNRLMGVLGKPALATAAASLLDVLGAATPAERGQVKALDQLDAPRGTLPLTALPLRPMLTQLAQTLELVAPHVGSIYPLELQHPLDGTEPAVLATRQIAAVLGLGNISVSIEGEDPTRAAFGVLQINERVARQPQGAAFRFWVGRALAGAATAGALVDRLSNGELGVLVEALFAQRPGTTAQQVRKQLNRALPRRVRKQLDQQRLESVDTRLWDHYRAEEQRRADRVGLLICGNPRVAVSQLCPAGEFVLTPRLRELMLFAISDRYDTLHGGVWG